MSGRVERPDLPFASVSVDLNSDRLSSGRYFEYPGKPAP